MVHGKRQTDIARRGGGSRRLPHDRIERTARQGGRQGIDAGQSADGGEKTRLPHQSYGQHAQIGAQQHHSHHRQRIRFTVLFEADANIEPRNHFTRTHAVHRTDPVFAGRRRTCAEQQSVLRAALRRRDPARHRIGHESAARQTQRRPPVGAA